MDFWDPLLLNSLASRCPIVIFDQAGVGRSSGLVATTYQGWADNVIALVQALGLKKIDLLGFSMGGWTVQMVALTRSDLIRKLIIAGSGPSMPAEKAEGIVWPRESAPSEAIRKLASADSESIEEVQDAITYSFFPHTDAGSKAARKYFGRIYTRAQHHHTEDPISEKPIFSLLDAKGTAEQRKAAVHWYDSTKSKNSFSRLGELKMSVLVINGDDDLLIPTSHGWELLRLVEDAQLIAYPKAGHGFLWQYAERAAGDVRAFLDEDLGAVTARL